MSPSLCRQAEGGRTAAVIASDLEKLGYKVWLDIYMKNISEDAMMVWPTARQPLLSSLI